MAGLIADHYQLIHVMTRFGIPIGFGEKSVREVCEDAGVDTSTFLAVVNFVCEGFATIDPAARLSLRSLLRYLKRSHEYFLEYSLPAIRRKLLEAIPMRGDDVSLLILKMFDEYSAEVRRHMEYEERMVFPYVEALLDGGTTDGFTIVTYSDHHEQVGERLGELKKILIKYCPSDAPAGPTGDVLFDIYRCEEELGSHCQVEDRIFVPEIKRLENHE